MATMQTPKESQQPERSTTAIGFALNSPQRGFCGVLGFALMVFACFSTVRDGPNYVAAIALGLGFSLLAAGLVGRFGRFKVAAAGTDVTYEPDYSTPAPKEPSPEQSAPPPPTLVEPDPIKLEIGRTDDGAPSTDVEIDWKEPFRHAVDALAQKDYPTFDSKMMDAIAAMQDEDSKVALKAYRLERLYCSGQSNRLEELQALREEHPGSPYPIMQLGDCHDLAGEHQKAAALYEEGYEIPGLSGDQRLMLVTRQAQALRKGKLFDEAETCLNKAQERADTDAEKAEVEKLLAALYKDWGKKEEMLVHFEKALKLSPGDIVRFELAYGYSDEGYKLAAFYHYDRLRAQRSGSAELNNLGVILQELDAPITAATLYRRAASGKNTLAAANLARMMAQGGLPKEARDVLTEARKEELVDEAVDTVSAAITRWEENEKERLGKIAHAGATERSLVLKRFELERQDLNAVSVEDIEGTWQTSVGDITFKHRNSKLVARFKEGYWDWELTGEVSGRTYSFAWTCGRRSQNQEGDGFFIFKTDDEFEGIIRHTPQKGEVRVVTGSERKPPAAPKEPTEPSAAWLEALRRRSPPS